MKIERLPHAPMFDGWTLRESNRRNVIKTSTENLIEIFRNFFFFLPTFWWKHTQCTSGSHLKSNVDNVYFFLVENWTETKTLTQCENIRINQSNVINQYWYIHDRHPDLMLYMDYCKHVFLLFVCFFLSTLILFFEIS